jgi:transposase InsO family protein
VAAESQTVHRADWRQRAHRVTLAAPSSPPRVPSAAQASGCTPPSVCRILKTERCNRKVYSTRDQARADVFDYIERFYNARRRHSTIGYLSLVEFENSMGKA